MQADGSLDEFDINVSEFQKLFYITGSIFID